MDGESANAPSQSITGQLGSAKHVETQKTVSAPYWASLLRFSSRGSVPVILQAEVSECGLACLAMIAEHHGIAADLLTLRTRYASSLRGTNLQELIDISGEIGLTARPIKVELDDLGQVQTPCVLHWDLNHFVVLTRVGTDWIETIDPAFGRRRIAIKATSNHFTGVAVEFEKGPDLRRKEERPAISLRTLAGSIRGLRTGLLQLFALALSLELIGLLVPQYAKIVIDEVLVGNDYALLHFLGISFSLLLLFRVTLELLRSWVTMWLSSTLNISWTGNVFNHLLKLPIDFFLKRHLGDVIARFGAITVIQQTITTKFVTVVLDGFMAVLTAAMLFYYSTVMAAVTISFSLIYACARSLYYRRLQETNLKEINVFAAQQGHLIESLRCIQTIRLNNRTSARAAKYMNATADAANTSILMQKLNLSFDAFGALTSGFQRIAVLWIGASLAIGAQLTPGMLVVFVAYADQFTSRFSGLVDYLVQLRLLRLQGERLADIALTPPEKFLEGIHVGNLSKHNIEFEGVVFSYGRSSKPVLGDCSFEIRDGEVVAITGESGAGKSTIARLLLGAIDYFDGTIRIGGIDMRMLGKHRARALMASVMQDDQVLSGTIMENISFFDPDAALENVIEAAKIAEFLDDVRQMPMGFHTIIGDMGSALSGGQLQRLMLARAFYRKPKILVLDEATSQLDLTNEGRIANSVRRLGLTAMIIAHRPQTILSADRVLVLKDGKISELSREIAKNIYGGIPD